MAVLVDDDDELDELVSWATVDDELERLLGVLALDWLCVDALDADVTLIAVDELDVDDEDELVSWAAVELDDDDALDPDVWLIAVDELERDDDVSLAIVDEELEDELVRLATLLELVTD